MSRIPSIMSLHLRYRLCIAEMNSDITILRIFDDCLQELASRKNEPEVQAGIDQVQQQFVSFRKEIDELRHEMHILKMKLAAYAKEKKSLEYKTYAADNHTALKKRYDAFRKAFEKFKNDFTGFEGKWLQ